MTFSSFHTYSDAEATVVQCTIQEPRGGGGGVMTLHDYGYLPPEFLKSYPVSEWNFQIYTLPRSLAFFQGLFLEGNLLLCKFPLLCYFSIVFYCFQTNFFGRRGKFPEQIASVKSQQSVEQCIKTQKWVVFKGNPNKFLYCMSSYNYEYVENIKTGINFPEKRQIS